jgi:hypothetical protein
MYKIVHTVTIAIIRSATGATTVARVSLTTTLATVEIVMVILKVLAVEGATHAVQADTCTSIVASLT